MSRTIRIPNGIVTLIEVDFKCPKCEHEHNQQDWYNKLYKSNKHYIYMNCKGCKTRLGVTTNIKGDVVAWLKDDENKKLNK